MNILHLNLKKRWFDMIRSGQKKEEYREIKWYWAQRLVYFKKGMEWSVIDEFLGDLQNPCKRHRDLAELIEYFNVEFRDFDIIRFKNGFKRPDGTPAPTFDIELKGITVKQGKQAWGAEKGKFYFTLKLGEIDPSWAQE